MAETGESHAGAAVAAAAAIAVCDACGLPPEPSKKLVRCGRCKSAWYHNAECQRMAYPAHKKRCRQATTATPAATTSTCTSSTAAATTAVTTHAASNTTPIAMFTVARRPNRGRCMIANRNLSKGTRIVSGDDDSLFQPMVAPVLMASAQSTRCAYCFARLSQNASDTSASCVLDGPPPQMRPLCHYFCSNRCMNRCKDRAQEEEMAAYQFVHRQSQQQEGRALKGATIRPTALLLFRLMCYMIETANYDRLSDLESHIDALKGSDGDQDEMNFIKTTAMVAKGLFMCSKLAGAVQNTGMVSQILDDDYFLQSAVSKIATNAFTICDGEGSSLGFGLYPAAAVINHSCEPNLVQTFWYGGSEGRPPTLLLTTCLSVEDRGELCIAYTDITAPKHRRRETLLKGYKFRCRCIRCEDAAAGGGGDDDEGINAKAQKRLEAFSIVERAMATSAAIGNNFASDAITGSPQSSYPTVEELQASYRSIKECCAKNSYYYQEAGEALVQSLLDRVGEAKSEGQQRELCFQALSVLEELEKNQDERCAILCPLPSLIRRYKIAKLQLFLVHDPRPSLMMLQDVHSELLMYFPRDHELIRDLESIMRGGMGG